MWKWTVSGVLLALTIQAASIAILLGGIQRIVTATSPDCGPVTRACAADPAREQAAPVPGEGWLLVLAGGVLSLVLPVSAVVGVVGVRRDPQQTPPAFGPAGPGT
ncbi:hypothetical protein [Streptomyces parvulus]|uniref:Uncharacterized protein n=1 Tax=Streptomyces parvulus TaxID=146923 RepID=A0A369UWH1_9ACTN|nr:hypothetical protein [Streptomyces parvulus]RDD84623.1 hypothetical protein DVZ84_34270 [Streptomyces parvulus]